MRSAGYFCATLERSAILTANCAAVSVGFTLSSSNTRKCLSITPPKCFWQRRMSLTIPHMPRHTTSSRVVVIYARDHLVPHFINTATFATRDFWPRRGASDAHTLQGSVRSEQRRRGQKEPSPGGLRRFSVLASLLLGHSPTSGDAPSSRLARTEKRRNKRGRIYETGLLRPLWLPREAKSLAHGRPSFSVVELGQPPLPLGRMVGPVRGFVQSHQAS